MTFKTQTEKIAINEICQVLSNLAKWSLQIWNIHKFFKDCFWLPGSSQSPCRFRIICINSSTNTATSASSVTSPSSIGVAGYVERQGGVGSILPIFLDLQHHNCFQHSTTKFLTCGTFFSYYFTAVTTDLSRKIAVLPSHMM